jgi:hypothetical protein
MSELTTQERDADPWLNAAAARLDSLLRAVEHHWQHDWPDAVERTKHALEMAVDRGELIDLFRSRNSHLSGETLQQRDAVCAAWHALPDELRRDPRLSQLYHALGGPSMESIAEAAHGDEDTTREDLMSLLREVRQCFTRDDDLPDNLLPRIDEVVDRGDATRERQHG